MLHMEQARAVVHGAWGGIGGDNAQSTSSSTSSSSQGEESISSMLTGEVDAWTDTRHSTICTFAGPAGSGEPPSC